MHVTTPDGDRVPLALRAYQPSDDTYLEGVERWLRYELDLDVIVMQT